MATASYKIKWEGIALIKSCNLKLKRFIRVVDCGKKGG